MNPRPGRPLSEARSTGRTVNVYIDGYNFYCSINSPNLLHLGWCNFSKLAGRLASRAFADRYVVGAVKYYTSKVLPDTEIFNRGEIERQNLWLEALNRGTKGAVSVIEGFHKRDRQKGRVEKQTDTNIAIGMVRDALVPLTDATPRIEAGRDKPSPCDAVVLISGDSDFRPAVEMIGLEYGKDVAVFYPHDDPRRPRPTGRIMVHRVTIEDLELCRLDDVIERQSGSPITWAEYQRLKRR